MEEKSYLGSESLPDIVPTSDEKTLAVLSHILTLVAPILAPLIIYLIKKDDSPFVLQHSRESLNFQISVAIICIILALTIIGLIIVWLVALAAFVFVIIASIRASEGKLYKYPFNFRLIK